MNKRQEDSLAWYLAQAEATAEDFRPEIGDHREEPAYAGWITFKDGHRIYMGIEPDGYRHT